MSKQPGLVLPLLLLHLAWPADAGRSAPLDAQAASPQLRPLTLSESLELALRQNRAIQIERLNPALARLALDEAYGYYDPTFRADGRRRAIADTGGYDPADLSTDAVYDTQAHTATMGLTGQLPSGLTYTLSGTYANTFGVRNGELFDSYNLFAGVSVRQPLLRDFWIDAGRLRIRVQRRLVRATEASATWAIMELVDQVAQAYYELAYARAHVQVQEKLLAVRERFELETRRRIEAGTLASLEEKLAQSQVAQVQTDLIAAGNAVALAQNELKLLLGESFRANADVHLVPADQLVIVPETLAREESWQRGLAQRPDLAQLRLAAETADLDLGFRRNQLFPALDLVAGYARRGADTRRTPASLPPASATAAFDELGSGAAPNDMIGVVLTPPLSRAAERARYRASKELQEQTRLRLEHQEEVVLREIDDALRTVEASRERVHATRRAAEYAAAAVEAEEQKLAVGRSTFFVVLELQSQLAGARSAEVRARADYNQALSRLHLAEGTLLEWRQLTLEFK